MAVVVHYSGERDGKGSRTVAIIKAVITMLLVAAIVGALLGVVTYVVSRQLVRLMS